MRLPPRPGLLGAVAVAALAGCAPGLNEELKTLVDDVVPVAHETVGCEWMSTKAVGGASTSQYECRYLLRGDAATVARSLVARLETRGFEATCRGNRDSFEVAAARETTRVVAVLYLPGADPEIPAGRIGLDLSAVESEELPGVSGPPCVTP